MRVSSQSVSRSGPGLVASRSTSERGFQFFKKFIAGAVALVATVGLAFSLSSLGASYAAGGGKPDTGLSPVGDASTSSQMLVPPWCGWRVSSLTESINLVPAEGEPTYYSGEEISLEQTGGDIYAYIGGASGETSKPTDVLEDGACSWFSDPAYGAQLNVELDSADFDAVAADGGPDGAMGFSATSTSNEFYVTYVPEEGGTCTADNFVPGDLSSFYTGKLSGRVWSVAADDAKVNNFCQFKLKYQVKIPSGMSPTFGDTTYTWTGPTLSFTLQVPED